MKKSDRSKKIRKLIEKWRPVLFLGEWHIDHKYVLGHGPDSDLVRGAKTAAEIFVNYTYKRAAITTYTGFWESSEDDQDSIVAHELSYCHTQELWDFCNDFQNGRHHTPDEVWKAVETLTQRISIIAKYGKK